MKQTKGAEAPPDAFVEVLKRHQKLARMYPDHVEREWDFVFGEFFRAGHSAGLLRAAEKVPTNWLDPLLTGKDGIGNGPYNCNTIERLLRGIAARIRAEASPRAEGEKEKE